MDPVVGSNIFITPMPSDAFLRYSKSAFGEFVLSMRQLKESDWTRLERRLENPEPQRLANGAFLRGREPTPYERRMLELRTLSLALPDGYQSLKDGVSRVVLTEAHSTDDWYVDQLKVLLRDARQIYARDAEALTRAGEANTARGTARNFDDHDLRLATAYETMKFFGKVLDRFERALLAQNRQLDGFK